MNSDDATFTYCCDTPLWDYANTKYLMFRAGKSCWALRRSREKLGYGIPSKEFSYAYTFVPVFRDRRELLQVLRTIINVEAETGIYSSETGIYSSVFSSVVLSYIWHITQRFFYINYLLDMSFIAFLMGVADCAREQTRPSVWIMVPLVVITGIELFGQLLELYSQCVLYGGRGEKGTRQIPLLERPHINFWTLHEYVMSMYAVCILFIIIMNTRNSNVCAGGDSHCKFLFVHPVWLAFFIMLKTNQLVIRTLAIRACGEVLIPVYRALMSRSCRFFIGFLALNYVTASVTYFAFPVVLYHGEGNTDTTRVLYWENKWAQMMSVFRLTFSGDFELNQLDGENEGINLTRTGSNRWAGEILDAPDNKHWHHGICVFYMLITFWINLCLLNIFIGFLENVYAHFEETSRQDFEAFRAVYSYKMLNRLEALHTWKCCCGLILRFLDVSPGDKQFALDCNHGRDHIWIAYDDKVLSKKDKCLREETRQFVNH